MHKVGPPLILVAAVVVQACVSPLVDAKSRLRDAFVRPSDSVLACPTKGSDLTLQTSVVGSVATAVLRSSEGLRYPVNDVYADLTPRGSSIGITDLASELFSVFSMQTGIFRSPAMAYLYERGWRQNFEAAGFPGIDAEHAEAAEYFAPVADGGTVVDLSCGSGLMSRRLVSSGRYERVLALDYSEEMLRETNRRFRDEGIPTRGLTLVRADAAELPLRPGSIDAIHAGAALHCWPRLELSLAQVAKSLKPGGRFFATTFYEGAVPGRRAQMQQPGTGSMRFFKDEGELVNLLGQAGFQESSLEVRREGRACAVIRAEA